MDTATAPSFAAQAPPRARTGRAALLLASVLAVTFLAYAGTLRFAFVYDDGAQILFNPAMRSWHNLLQLFGEHVWASQAGAVPNYYRPVFMAWCLVQYKLFGANPLPWHLALVMLHLLATALVFQLARRLFADDFVATSAAVIFGLHPIHVESVAWISGATDPLMAVFCLGSFLCYMRYRDSRMPSFAWLALSLGLYGLACLSKEPAVVFVGVIAAFEYLTWDEPRVPVKIVHAAVRTFPFLMIAAAYLVQRWIVLRAIGHANVPLAAIQLPLSWPTLLWFYAHKLAWPSSLALFYNMQYVTSPSWSSFWMPLLLVVAITAVLLFLVGRLPSRGEAVNASPRAVAYLGLAWMIFFILPVLDVISLEPGEIAHDRYLYLPSVGFALLLALLISRVRLGTITLFGAPAVQVGCVVAIASALAFGTVRDSGYWANDLLLYYRAVQVSPASLTAANRLANALLDRNYAAEGMRLHEQILRSNPDFWQSHFQLGNAYFQAGRYRESEEQLAEAARLHPGAPQIWMYLAISQMKNQNYADAERSVRTAIAAQPTTLGGHYTLGLILEQQGRWREAVAAFEQELALDPDQPRVRAELDAAHGHLQ